VCRLYLGRAHIQMCARAAKRSRRMRRKEGEVDRMKEGKKGKGDTRISANRTLLTEASFRNYHFILYTHNKSRRRKASYIT
jgi:hypothetical protein